MSWLWMDASGSELVTCLAMDLRNVALGYIGKFGMGPGKRRRRRRRASGMLLLGSCSTKLRLDGPLWTSSLRPSPRASTRLPQTQCFCM